MFNGNNILLQYKKNVNNKRSFYDYLQKLIRKRERKKKLYSVKILRNLCYVFQTYAIQENIFFLNFLYFYVDKEINKNSNCLFLLLSIKEEIFLQISLNYQI